MAENTAAGQAIGDPVVAEDEDGDILTYTLTSMTVVALMATRLRSLSTGPRGS